MSRLSSSNVNVQALATLAVVVENRGLTGSRSFSVSLETSSTRLVKTDT